MAQTRIFISHSSQDDSWCRPFADALTAVGYDVWYDQAGLTGGAAWVEAIQREVQARDVFLVVLTPEALDSPWVRDELQLAIATRRRVLPILLRNCQVDGFLLTTQWVTVIGEEPAVAARSAIIAIEAPPASGRTPTTAPEESLDDLVTLCQSLTAERRYTEALSACDRALALAPDNVEVLRVKGTVLQRVGQTSRAATAFARVLELLPLDAADPDLVWDLSEVVYDYSDDAETVVQTCRTAMQLLRRSVGQSTRDWHFDRYVSERRPNAIRRLVELGAVQEAASLIAEEGALADLTVNSVFVALAGANRADLLFQLADRLGRVDEAVRDLVGTYHPADAMERAPQVRDARTRDALLKWLNQQQRYGDVDTLCRGWFGYPPPSADPDNPSPVDFQAYASSLRYWSFALHGMGRSKEAAAMSKLAEGRRGRWW